MHCRSPQRGPTEMLSRREVLVTPVAMMIAAEASGAGKMSLAIHQNTSAAAGYRASLEGWARAGIKNVEITAALLDGFLKNRTLAFAKRVLTDNALTPASAASGVGGSLEPKFNTPGSV